MEQKRVSLDVKFLEDGAEEGSFEAVFATLDVVDLDGDIIRPGALKGGNVRVSAYNHSSWGGALPVGRGIATERGDELVFKGRFFLSTTMGRDTYLTVKELSPDLQQYSFGYDVLTESRPDSGSKANRIIESMDVFEISPVLLGAGIATRTLDVKSGGLRLADHIDMLRDGMTELAGRVQALKEMREADGRQIGATTIERLTLATERLDELHEEMKSLIAAPHSGEPTEAEDEEVVDLVAEFNAVASTLAGVDIWV